MTIEHFTKAEHRRRRVIEILRQHTSSSADSITIVASAASSARRLIAEFVATCDPVRDSRPSTSPLPIYAHSLRTFAHELAVPTLAKRALIPATRAPLLAAAARTVLTDVEPFGLLEPIRDTPGFSPALLDAFEELSGAQIGPLAARLDELDAPLPILRRLFVRYRKLLEQEGLADDAALYTFAKEALTGSPQSSTLILFDIVSETRAEAEFVDALLCFEHSKQLAPPAVTAVTSVASYLTFDAFSETSSHQDDALALSKEAQAKVEFFSGRSEAEEAREVARRILALADGGLRYDQIGIAVTNASRYQGYLRSALRRAEIPVCFQGGAKRPDPSGRAFLALLRCADEDLSASAFSAYLAFGVCPETVAGAPPPGFPQAIFDDALFAGAEERNPHDQYEQEARDDPRTFGANLRAPERLEALLIDAAVIGSRARWSRRLSGLERSVQLAIDRSNTEAEIASLKSQRQDLRTLRDFALPVLDELAALPRGGTWRQWREALENLASRTLAEPERVLRVLSTLAPLGDLGQVTLSEVQSALESPLSEVRDRFVATPGSVRVFSMNAPLGESFDHLFVVGLSENLWPPRHNTATLLPASARHALPLRSEQARRLQPRSDFLNTLGAGRDLTLSYASRDGSKGTQQSPSSYFLDAAVAHFGKLIPLRHFELPASPPLAMDALEWDRLQLDDALRNGPKGGELAYTLYESPALYRAMAQTYARFDAPKWSARDGLVDPALVTNHRLEKRAYSATGLENFSLCPYRFFLRQVLRLEEREVPVSREQIPPRDRGTLVHTVLYRATRALIDAGLWPLSHPERRRAAEAIVHHHLMDAAKELEEELAPAIKDVWDEAIRELDIDLRRWISELDPSWRPVAAELAFGLGHHGDERDPQSQKEPVAIGKNGRLQLRGSIDLVELHDEGSVRATDHKTGSPRGKHSMQSFGGAILQPALYALSLEKLMGQNHKIQGGRLHFATRRGAFSERVVPLTEELRQTIDEVIEIIDGAIERGQFPAVPKSKYDCRYCDYLSVCGPGQGDRAHLLRHGKKRDFVAIDKLRKLP